jgi:CubicO group peptidase (beta-lactamase class C family)
LAAVPQARAAFTANEPAHPVDCQTSARVGELIDDYLAPLSDHGFSGVVWVAQADCLRHVLAYGVADHRTGRAVATDSVFAIGSITKLLTALGVYALAADGRIDLDRPVANYLDILPEDKSGITVRHLLTHRSGLESDYWDQNREYDTEAGYLAMMVDRPLLSEPGERFRYNNFGYHLLKRVIEEVSGQDYESYLDERLLSPLGTSDIGYRRPGWSSDRLALYEEATATAWSRTLAVDLANPLHRPVFLQPEGSGGLLATAPAIGELFHGLFRTDLFGWPVDAHFPRPGQGEYGAGLWVRDTPLGRRISHGGYDDTLGIVAEMAHFSQDDITIVLLSNTHLSRRFDSDSARELIDRAIAGLPTATPPDAENGTPQDAQQFSGTYESVHGAVLEFSVDAFGRPALTARDPVAAALLRFPELARPTPVPPPSSITRLVDALQQDDEAAFLSLVSPDVRSSAYFNQARAAWQQIGGLLGRARGLSRIHSRTALVEGREVTWWFVATHHEHGSYPLRFVEDEAGALYVLPAALDTGLPLSLAQLSETEFTAWWPALGRATGLQFSATGDQLTLVGADGVVLTLTRQAS